MNAQHSLATLISSAVDSSRSVIVYGPKACGKTRHADSLAAHYGVSLIVDDWTMNKNRRIRSDALMLTEYRPVGPFPIKVEIVRFEDAMAEMSAAIAEGM